MKPTKESRDCLKVLHIMWVLVLYFLLPSTANFIIIKILLSYRGKSDFGWSSAQGEGHWSTGHAPILGLGLFL